MIMLRHYDLFAREGELQRVIAEGLGSGGFKLLL